MNANFSEQEYRRLMTLAILGEWLVNAIRKDPDPAFEDVLSKTLSFAHETPLDALVWFDPDTDSWAPAEDFERDAHALIDQYDDKTFWEELTARLVERDMYEVHGEQAVRSMRPEQRERAASSIAKAYTKEFEDVGLDRLRIDETISPEPQP